MTKCHGRNFSRSRSELDLAARRAIEELSGPEYRPLAEFANPESEGHRAMVERVRQRLNLTTLKYQRLPDLVSAIGLPKEKLCTYCWDGAEPCVSCPKKSATKAPVLAGAISNGSSQGDYTQEESRARRLPSRPR